MCYSTYRTIEKDKEFSFVYVNKASDLSDNGEIKFFIYMKGDMFYVDA